MRLTLVNIKFMVQLIQVIYKRTIDPGTIIVHSILVLLQLCGSIYLCWHKMWGFPLKSSDHGHIHLGNSSSTIEPNILIQGSVDPLNKGSVDPLNYGSVESIKLRFC